VPTSDELGTPMQRVLAQVGARDVPLKVRREVHPRRDVDVAAKAEAERTFCVSNLIDRLEESELIVDPLGTGSPYSLLDLLDDGNNSLLGYTVSQVSFASY
jgi:hypothetical protein